MKTRRRTMQIELREYQKQDFKALETINQRNLAL